MIQPDIDDATLEYAAQLVERGSFTDLAGIMAKRKRDREDAVLRMRSREEVRAEIAAHLRAMMSRPELSAVNVLRRISELGDREFDHAAMLHDAWPLAWKRWVKITALLNCASNQIPPETEYRISLTDRGREVLAKDVAP